jgi:uncharacterized protein (DUF2235 family)
MTRNEAPSTPPRNIVICCDGTSNEPGAATTNVVRMFRCLEKTDQQIVFYDPGVGTSGILDLWKRRSNRIKAALAQATGYGLDDHVTGAYRFLCANYRPGDRVSIFGFSRGAYTARVVAGLVHQIGVLHPEQVNLAAFALKAYKQSSDEDDLAVGWRFARALGTRRATIHFLGLWDTVGSMIAPLKDRLGFGLTHLPYTTRNPSVATVRHAMALDERRRMFRLSVWKAGPFVANPFDLASVTNQDVREVWFAGAHGDVGGGHPEAESGLSKISLLWMAGEAAAAGLSIDRNTLRGLALGETRHGKMVHCAANANAQMHPQPAGGWWILEYLPKRTRWREWGPRRSVLGHYLPAGEPRPVPSDASLHRSVIERMDRGSYLPSSLSAGIDRMKVEDNLDLLAAS